MGDSKPEDILRETLKRLLEPRPQLPPRLPRWLERFALPPKTPEPHRFKAKELDDLLGAGAVKFVRNAEGQMQDISGFDWSTATRDLYLRAVGGMYATELDRILKLLKSATKAAWKFSRLAKAGVIAAARDLIETESSFIAGIAPRVRKTDDRPREEGEKRAPSYDERAKAREKGYPIVDQLDSLQRDLSAAADELEAEHAVIERWWRLAQVVASAQHGETSDAPATGSLRKLGELRRRLNAADKVVTNAAKAGP